jgi:prepilin-type processing-associated H-X9-DG protein
MQPEARGWSGWDLMLSGLAAMALFGIVLPGILRGRFIARNIACQDNLRDAGVALTYFALQNPQQQLPQLASEGNEAFAGLFSVKLRDKELIQRMDQLLCPSLDRPKLLFERPPTTDQVRAAEGAALRAMQQFSGGSYAYNLGVMSENRYQSPRYQGRTAFAILGDAPVPIASLPNFSAAEGAAANRRGGALQATSVGHQPVRYGHGGRGVNLLFEDGHVIFLPVGDAMMTHDHPFLNHRGDIEAGVNIDDATLAPSAYPPFADVQQR